MEITLEDDENAVFVGIKMTEDGVESSVFNMDFSTDEKRTCSILALGAAASIINDTPTIEEKGIEEFVKFTKSIFTKGDDDEYDPDLENMFEDLKGVEKSNGKITYEDNVINISELLKERKDK